ncbi:pentapeptide repeat-containing protein [Halobellus ruber]|uniref:Pentapeptide repeat-containing protein n=1 Tax=Halobellus ruber TaxID=2761102 RepID=A0A7J9SPQ0_9EURY|nr:pentapeptide repeat-containing protein [Halobellus ruber]MBB6647501.1 pentapeptide repeat-containing protein [Halobellus ruber]
MSPDSSTQREECPVTNDDLDLADAVLDTLEIASWSCSRPAWEPEKTGSSRCIRHTETAEKPLDELVDEINDGDLHGAIASKTVLSSLELPSSPGFVGADLSGAALVKVDLSGAALVEADLSGADLWGVDLSGATLADADLSAADLRKADLPVANLRGADLSEADLRYADLSEKDLSGVTLSQADIRGTTLEGLSANQGTTVGKMCPDPASPAEYDALAQAYHDLKEALSDEGLSQRARRARGLERQARTAEAWARFKTNAVLRRVNCGP